MASKSLLQREIKKHVIAQLHTSLIELKDLLGEKKFSNRVKKAAKLLTDGIAKTKKEEGTEQKEENVLPAPETVTPKKAAKKATVKKKVATPVKAVKKTVTAKKPIPAKK